MASNSSKLWNLLHQSLPMAYTEDDVRNACFTARRYSNVSRIARLNGIPRSTLRWRLQGLLPKPATHAHEIRLSPTLKTKLTEFIRLQAAIRAPLTHRIIRELAQRICVKSGDDKRIGKGWCTAFLRRNPVLKT